MKKSLHICVLAVCLLGGNALTAQTNITSISASNDVVTLQWSTFGTNYIVEARPSLVTGDWDYVGQVISTNLNTVSNLVSDQMFYRIRKVDMRPSCPSLY